ncbi:MAG: OmpA family protein [Verrucomicrobiota bacterium]
MKPRIIIHVSVISLLGLSVLASAEEPIAETPSEIREQFAGAFDREFHFLRSAGEAEPAVRSINLSIDFETGSDEPSVGGHDKLKVLAAEMADSKYRRLILLIEGHCDTRGSGVSNLHLSEARADRVRMALIEAGIDPQNLLSAGKGESFPLVSPESGEEDYRKNRRVVVRFAGLLPETSE